MEYFCRCMDGSWIKNISFCHLHSTLSWNNCDFNEIKINNAWIKFFLNFSRVLTILSKCFQHHFLISSIHFCYFEYYYYFLHHLKCLCKTLQQNLAFYLCTNGDEIQWKWKLEAFFSLFCTISNTVHINSKCLLCKIFLHSIRRYGRCTTLIQYVHHLHQWLFPLQDI